MSEPSALDPYGKVTEPTTLEIQRLLPGTIDRVWAYLTESDLRRKWLASGEMQMKAGTSFELVWRNNELTDPPGKAPDGFSGEHRMQGKVVKADPPRRLVFTWGVGSEVTFALEPVGQKVLLTVTHRRLPDRENMLNVGAGWHAHLDILAARLSETQAEPFWDSWTSLKAEYRQRIPD
jgi:uncharacterized protein YndB with AHSA1/START domain